MELDLEPLGAVARLQIQRSTLKVGEKPNRAYDLAPLLSVDTLVLTPEGALVRQPGGGAVLDVHHTGHPQTHNSRGLNDLSLGFTPNYARMRERYGAHLFDGCAGENILIATERPVDLEMLARGLAIRPAGGGAVVWLRHVRVALPCREFSGYATGGGGAEAIKEALQFLDGGLRGYYCAFDGPGEAPIAVGDAVLVPAG